VRHGETGGLDIVIDQRRDALGWPWNAITL